MGPVLLLTAVTSLGALLRKLYPLFHEQCTDIDGYQDALLAFVVVMLLVSLLAILQLWRRAGGNLLWLFSGCGLCPCCAGVAAPEIEDVVRIDGDIDIVKINRWWWVPDHLESATTGPGDAAADPHSFGDDGTGSLPPQDDQEGSVANDEVGNRSVSDVRLEQELPARGSARQATPARNDSQPAVAEASGRSGESGGFHSLLVLLLDLISWFPVWCAFAPTVATQDSHLLRCGRPNRQRRHRHQARSCCRSTFDLAWSFLCLLLAILALVACFGSVHSVRQFAGAARVEERFDSVHGGDMSGPALISRGSTGTGGRHDHGGVVTIEGETEYDVFFAQGYVHASTRLLQMELQRRAGAGKLSAMLGDATLDTDMAMRTWGFYLAAERAAEALPEAVRSQLQAYADGVNHFLAEKQPLPLEMQLIGAARPAPWVITDTLVFAKLMALDLAGNGSEEADRMKAVFGLGIPPDRLEQLQPTFFADGTRGFDTVLSPEEIGLGATDTADLADRHCVFDSTSADANLTAAGEPVGAPASLPAIGPAELETGNYFTAAGLLLGSAASPRYSERAVTDANYHATLALINRVRARKGLDPLPDVTEGPSEGRRAAANEHRGERASTTHGHRGDGLQRQRDAMAAQVKPLLRRLLRAGRGEADEAVEVTNGDEAEVAGSALAAAALNSIGLSPATPSHWRPRKVGKLSGVMHEYKDRGASNNWVVHGNLTDTGRPILADDPHMDLSVPSVWTLMHLKVRSTGLELLGSAFAGTPGVIIGRNNHGVAWGVTSVNSDEEDLYVIDESADGASYHHHGRELPFLTRTEVIEVADGDAVTITVRETVHGPVLFPDNDAGPAFFGGGNRIIGELGAPIALRWPGVSRGFVDRTATAMYRLQRAASWSDFRNAMAEMTTPPQNFVFAGKQRGVDGVPGGEIGYQLPGFIPVRPANFSGGFPSPGDGSAEWRGMIPFDQMPRTHNPPKGYIASANNRVTPATYLPAEAPYRYHITTDWNEHYGFRHADISETIVRTAMVAGGHSVTDSQRLQASFRSIGAARYVAPLQHMDLVGQCPGSGLSRRGLDLVVALFEASGLAVPAESGSALDPVGFGLSNAPNASLDMSIGAKPPILWAILLAELLRLPARELNAGSVARHAKPFLLRVLQDTAVMESFSQRPQAWAAANLSSPDPAVYWGAKDRSCIDLGHASCLGFVCEAVNRAADRVAAAGDAPSPRAASWADSTPTSRSELLSLAPAWSGEGPLPRDFAQRGGVGVHHVLAMEHPVLDDSPLECMANRYYRRGGGSFTPNAGHWSEGDPWMRTGAGPALRAVFELPATRPEGSSVIITPGQSGNLLSPHYDDLAALWNAGEYLTAPRLAADEDG